jgi:BirA family biotin operon repressor/biotin-[acetyl-CoA-carboxylase] ligase
VADAPLSWGAEALWEALQPLLPGLSVEIVASLGSTNTTLLERARAGLAGGHADDAEGAGVVQVRRSVESTAFGRRAVDWQPCLLVAEQQTAGRGRMGREWHASPTTSLTFSLSLPMAPADWSGLSLAVGAAVAEALDPLAPDAGKPPRIGLKWPNDLWLLNAPGDATGGPAIGRKLGGILIETVAAGSKRLAVVGIGLNVQPLALQPGEASTGVGSLSELMPGISPPEALGRLALPLVQALLQFESHGFAAFASRFEARDLLKGRPVTTTHPEATTGVACGVASDGGLIIDTGSRRLHLHSGEVSVRPAGPAC